MPTWMWVVIGGLSAYLLYQATANQQQEKAKPLTQGGI